MPHTPEDSAASDLLQWGAPPGLVSALEACGEGLWDRFRVQTEAQLGDMRRLVGTPEPELRDILAEFLASCGQGVQPTALRRGAVMRELVAWAAPGAASDPGDAGGVDALVTLQDDIAALAARRRELEDAAGGYTQHVANVGVVVGAAAREVRGCCDRLRGAVAQREAALLSMLQDVVDAEATRAAAAQDATSALLDDVAQAEAAAAAADASGDATAALSTRRRRAELVLGPGGPPLPALTDVTISVDLADDERHATEAILALGAMRAARGLPHVVVAFAAAVLARYARQSRRRRGGGPPVWVSLCRGAPAVKPPAWDGEKASLPPGGGLWVPEGRCHAAVGAAEWNDVIDASTRIHATQPWGDGRIHGGGSAVADPLSIPEHLLRLIWETNSPAAAAGLSPPRARVGGSPGRSPRRAAGERQLEPVQQGPQPVWHSGALLMTASTLQVREDPWPGPRGYVMSFEGTVTICAAEVELVLPPGVKARVIVVRRGGAAPARDGDGDGSGDDASGAAAGGDAAAGDAPRVVAEGSEFVGHGRAWYLSEFDDGFVLLPNDAVMWLADMPGARDCIVHNNDAGVRECGGTGIRVSSCYSGVGAPGREWQWVSPSLPAPLLPGQDWEWDGGQTGATADSSGALDEIRSSAWSVQMRVHVSHALPLTPPTSPSALAPGVGFDSVEIPDALESLRAAAPPGLLDDAGAAPQVADPGAGGADTGAAAPGGEPPPPQQQQPQQGGSASDPSLYVSHPAGGPP